MAQSLAQVYLHIVFSTKNRLPWLEDPALRRQTYAYLTDTCQNLKSPAICIGGVADHVHVLCRLSRQLSIADLVREMKRESSKWLKGQAPALESFYWQNGYGGFSISPGHVEKLTHYIANQEEHHKTESFQDEFRRVLAIYQIEYDEKYVWD